MQQYADENRDGSISLEEFMEWVKESVIFESGVDIFLPASTAMAALIADKPPVRFFLRKAGSHIAAERVTDLQQSLATGNMNVDSVI